MLACKTVSCSADAIASKVERHPGCLTDDRSCLLEPGLPEE
jgi:hypothetical protein